MEISLINEEILYLQQKINNVQKKLEDLPNENIHCISSGRYTKWFVGEGGERKYLSKKDRDYALKLAQAKYNSLLLEDLHEQLNAAEKYKIHISKACKAKKLLSEKPYANLLSRKKYSLDYASEIINIWLNEEYTHNTSYPENLVHETSFGLKVRSKSEEKIAEALYARGIPFRYEARLIVDDIEFYPDFTLFHPTKLKEYYWEHYGLMDDPRYISNAFGKMTTFSNNGIIPGINLITTYEDKYHPLHINDVNLQIDRFLSLM